MELVFDISPDEMPIFLAETEEQLQVLEEGLVRIENEPDNTELIQGLFRAAHTLKGMAGMIGHKRLVDLTHALENGFDGIRKNQFPVTTHFIDICLESIDGLRLLREEVIDRTESDVDVETLVTQIQLYISSATGGDRPPAATAATPKPPTPAAGSEPLPALPNAAVTSPEIPIASAERTPVLAVPEGKIHILNAEIARNSVASAARAFQLMMTLQSSGTLLEMHPTQEEIETSRPVAHFCARFIPTQPLETIRQDLNRISEIDYFSLEEEKPAQSKQPVALEEAIPDSSEFIWIEADISPKSVASAARAFQIMMGLQATCKILEITPTEAEINTSKPVAHFKARVVPYQPIDKIRKELTSISEIDRLVIGDMVIELVQPKSSSPVQTGEKNNGEPPRLGEYLVENGTITPQQLEAALTQQKESGKQILLGQVLVEMGYCDHETLDQAVSKYMQSQRAALQAAQESEKNKEKTIDKTVRTSVERLDALMNLVGELITDRNRLNQLRNKLENTYRGNDEISTLSDTIVHVGRITDQLQEEVMHIRMQPVANVFNKFPRMVRDLAQKTGKELDLVLRGQDTELDRSVIEEINDPLIHLLRNAVDHGIEAPGERRAAGKDPRGTVILAARHEQGRIILTVEDDGKGINLDQLKKSAVQKGIITDTEASAMTDDKAIDLIFASGVSTAKTISDISGRGVGMDIVRNNIERLNGTIVVETHPGKGSQFIISLPLTLAIVPTLLVKVGETTFAIPLVMVIETQRLKQEEIYYVHGKPVTKLRDKLISLLQLADIFKMNKSEEKEKYMVVVRSSKVEIGLVVDKLVGEEEVVVKSLNSLVGDTPGISSAAILGDGQVALILDIPGLFKLVGLH